MATAENGLREWHALQESICRTPEDLWDSPSYQQMVDRQMDVEDTLLSRGWRLSEIHAWEASN